MQNPRMFVIAAAVFVVFGILRHNDLSIASAGLIILGSIFVLVALTVFLGVFLAHYDRQACRRSWWMQRLAKIVRRIRIGSTNWLQ